MIARLSGTLFEINLTRCVIDIGGVGYEVFIPMSTFDRLPRQGENVALLINTQVREESITLYGFATVEEKELFEILITASGVGPRLALNILSSLPVSTFSTAIINADLKMLGRISGIGKRTAEKLVIELKDKIRKIMPTLTVVDKNAAGADKKAVAAEDALMALEQLGFKGENIRKALKKIVDETPDEDVSSENLIRLALQALNT